MLTSDRADKIKILYDFTANEMSVSLSVKDAGSGLGGCDVITSASYSLDSDNFIRVTSINSFSSTCAAISKETMKASIERKTRVSVSPDGQELTLTLVGDNGGRCDSGVDVINVLQRIQ